MACGNDREACLINFGQHINLHAINHIILTTVNNHTLNTGQSLQLLGGDVVGVNLAIHTQRTDSPCKHRIVVAAKVQYYNHILFHTPNFEF